jgi:hypothetical protein
MDTAAREAHPAQYLAALAGQRQAGDIEERACRRDVLGSLGVGKEPVVADAVEALGNTCIRKRLMNSCG